MSLIIADRTDPNASTPPRQMPDGVDVRLQYEAVAATRVQLRFRLRAGCAGRALVNRRFTACPSMGLMSNPYGELPRRSRTYRFLRVAFFLVAFFLVAAFLSLAIAADASLLCFATAAAALFLAAATCFFSAAASFL
jgi:hypothetical protein